MLIIVEGSDLSGKSTFCAGLQTYLSAKYPRAITTLLHRGPPTSHPLDEYVRPLLRYRPTGKEHVICDRWHLGELVYSQLLRRPTKMTPAVFRYVEAFLESRGAIMVVIDQPADVLRQRYAERGDQTRTLHEVLRASDLFVNTIKRSTLTWANVTRNPMVTAIHDIAYRHQIEASNISPFTYVGSLRPDTIYVGDRRSCEGGLRCAHKVKHAEWFPAFGPYPNTSGAFLFDQLPASKRFGVMNINDVDAGAALGLIQWKSPSALPARVVALGRVASRILKHYGVVHTAVAHPQYIKRFHHREHEWYRELLTRRDGGDYITWRS